MRLRAHDQIHVTSVKADSLRPGEEFEISDAAGAELMKAHPGLFEEASGQKAAPVPENKAAPVPENKADPEPVRVPGATRRDMRDMRRDR